MGSRRDQRHGTAPDDMCAEANIEADESFEARSDGLDDEGGGCANRVFLVA